jgi:agmatine deiminase
LSKPDCRPYLPPEWAEQAGVMLTWPHDRGDWGEHLAEVEKVFVDMATAITRFETCLIVCRDEDHRQSVLSRLQQVPQDRLVLAIAESNDVWARDHGPLAVMCQEEPLLLNFRFNGWGGKYRADLDNAIVSKLFRQNFFGDSLIEDIDLVFEGGAIEVDGSGSFLATKHSVVTDTRNPGKSQQEIEALLADRLGIERFLWLEHGALEGDDTDGHIDTLARFADRDTILYCHCSDNNDSHFDELNWMEAELQGFKSATGAPYKLVPLPLPAAKIDEDGHRLPATYANFLIINGAVLVPTYRDDMDEAALDVFRNVFPNREIVAIDCLPLVHQYGSLHCATMQLPRAVELHKS